jgi:hypothetical protein
LSCVFSPFFWEQIPATDVVVKQHSVHEWGRFVVGVPVVIVGNGKSGWAFYCLLFCSVGCARDGDGRLIKACVFSFNALISPPRLVSL